MGLSCFCTTVVRRDTRQDAGELFLQGPCSLTPRKCVCVGDRDRHGQVTWLSSGDWACGTFCL